MKNLFDPAEVSRIKQRISQLKPESKRLWGTMNAPQAVAHLAAALEVAMGDHLPPRKLQSYILGPIIRRLALGNDEPMRRNSPTVDGLEIKDARVLEVERKRLSELMDRFVQGGPDLCTTHPHSFLGRLTPMQWAVLQYKHLDHHLRQFGV